MDVEVARQEPRDSAGERDYSALYREIGPQLWRAVLVYAGGRREVADDAVGEAFARAIESDRSIRRPFPWLYKTAFRIAAAELRRESSAMDEADVHLDDPATGDLLRAMRRLSPSQRAAVFLHYQADLPVREVARLMGTSSAAVKVHLHRGRNRLREILGPEEVNDD
jgi:RNA polymerase sigma-70 factor (ECF subfamily)